MFWLALFSGLGAGALICFAWQQRQNQQVRKMLYSYSDRPAEVTSLTPLSSVRRELKLLYEEKHALQQEIEQWYFVLDAAPYGYLRVDRDNQILWCNLKARQLLHLNRWQPGQVRLLLELVRSFELDQLIERTRQSQSPQTLQWQFYPSHEAQTHTDSPENSLHLQGFSLPMPNQQVAVFVENQEEMYHQRRSQEQLLADLTHELRTPLTSIRLIAETLELRLEGQEHKWVMQILQEINRLFYLVQDWLEISRLEAHPHQVLSYQTFDLPTLLKDTWSILEPLAQQKHVTLCYQGEETLTIQGDKDRLIQVFLNLFDNAIKHSPDRQTIFVKLATTAKIPPQVMIEVIDQGTGFAAEDLPYIFERLYRGDQARTRSPKHLSSGQGNGLGLSIVEQIIKAHGGQIHAQNHPELQGAWLSILLPLSLPNEDFDI